MPGNRIISFLVLTIFLSSPPFEAGLSAQDKEPRAIMFLRLRLSGTTVSLLRATTRPGTLKKSRSGRERTGISYEVTSLSGEVIWNGSVEDPTLRRYEYEDPDHPGRMRTRTISVDSAEFTIRIPVSNEMDKIHFDRNGRSPLPHQRMERREMLGIIAIPREGVGR